MGKPLWKSKEFWVNAVAFVLVVLALPEFVAVIPVSWIPYIALLAAVLTVLLRRFSTKEPITSIF